MEDIKEHEMTVNDGIVEIEKGNIVTRIVILKSGGVKVYYTKGDKMEIGLDNTHSVSNEMKTVASELKDDKQKRKIEEWANHVFRLESLAKYANRFAAWANQDFIEKAYIGNLNHEKLITAMMDEFPEKCVKFVGR